MTKGDTIPVVVAGATGKTGSAVARAVHAVDDLRLAGALSRRRAGSPLAEVWGDPTTDLVLTDNLADVDAPYAVLVDFTEPESAAGRLLEAVERHWDIVVGTTGFSRDVRRRLSERVEQHGVGAALIANFSLGAWVAERLAAEASRYFESVEVIEGHHAQKRDKPSGTAKAMANLLAAKMNRSADEVPVHSLRLPGMVAHQAVIFGAQGQLLTIRHDVHDRTAYVDGVLAAIRQVHRFGGRMVSDLGQVLNPDRLADDS